MFDFPSVKGALGGALLIACLSGSPASAAALSFISAKGVDAGDCSSASAPCRSLSYAHGQTAAGGEIKTLDPGHYGGVIIRKAITITGSPGSLILSNGANPSISVNAGANDVVTITGFTFNGFNRVAPSGIKVNSGAQLVVRNCIIRSYRDHGIHLTPTGALRFLIEDTLVSSNGASGIRIEPIGSAIGSLNRVTSNANDMGLSMLLKAQARISDSMFVNNTSVGISLAANTTIRLRLTKTTISRNGTGFRVDAPGGPISETANDNFIRGNGIDVFGALNSVGTQ